MAALRQRRRQTGGEEVGGGAAASGEDPVRPHRGDPNCAGGIHVEGIARGIREGRKNGKGGSFPVWVREGGNCKISVFLYDINKYKPVKGEISIQQG